MTMYLLTLKSSFVMSEGAKNGNVFTNFGVNFVMSKGAKNGNVFTFLSQLCYV